MRKEEHRLPKRRKQTKSDFCKENVAVSIDFDRVAYVKGQTLAECFKTPRRTCNLFIGLVLDTLLNVPNVIYKVSNNLVRIFSIHLLSLSLQSSFKKNHYGLLMFKYGQYCLFLHHFRSIYSHKLHTRNTHLLRTKQFLFIITEFIKFQY